MITPERLKELTTLSAPTLTRLAKESGYKGPAFSSSRFLGITNGCEFCYMVVFLVKGGTDSTKLFINPIGSRVSVDYRLTELA